MCHPWRGLQRRPLQVVGQDAGQVGIGRAFAKKIGPQRQQNDGLAAAGPGRKQQIIYQQLALGRVGSLGEELFKLIDQNHYIVVWRFVGQCPFNGGVQGMGVGGQIGGKGGGPAGNSLIGLIYGQTQSIFRRISRAVPSK